MRLNRNYYPWLFVGLVITFIASRLYNLLGVPIFTDESIYIRWAQIFRGDINQLFVSLNDGKQPLFIWIGAGFLHLSHNPLFTMRLVSVVFGLLTMAGIYFLTKELFGNKIIALTASLLYIISPFALVYDKLALYDGMLATFAVWSLYIEVLLAKQVKFIYAVAAALILSGALLTKSSAFFYLYLLPLSLLVFNYKGRDRNKQFAKWIGLAILVIGAAIGCYSILKLSPNYKYISAKNGVFVYPLSEWIKHPFRNFISNLGFLSNSLVVYVTIPVLIAAAIALFIDKKFIKEKLLLLAWFVIPFVALVFFGKLLYPRYIFFMTMPLLVLAASALVVLMEKIDFIYLKVTVIIILLLPALIKDGFLLTDFQKASIPKEDHYQYVAGFESGVGVQKTVSFLSGRSKSHRLLVGTEGTFGLMPDALQDYLNGNKNIQINSYWPIPTNIPTEIETAAQVTPTYFVFYAPCPNCQSNGQAPKTWPVRPVFSITRLDQSKYTLYEVVK